MEFQHLVPVKIIFGQGKIKETGKLCKNLGRKAVVVTGKSSAKQSKALESLMTSLSSEDISIVLYSEVDGEPDVFMVDRGVALIKEENCDMVIGLGGGSALDVAKTMAMIAVHGGSAQDYFGAQANQKLLSQNGLPFIAIPTTAGTASEVTRNAVIKNRKNGLKQSIYADNMFAKIAIVDPELTITAPPKVTAEAGMDAFTHALESYLSIKANPLSEALSYKAIALIFNSLEAAVRNGSNIEARENMALGSLIAGISFGNVGLGLCHGISPALGSIYTVTHGISNAVLLPYILEFNKDVAFEKIAELYCFTDSRRENISTYEKAESVISRIRQLNIQIGIPEKLRMIGVEKEDFSKLVELTFQGRSVYNNPKPVLEADVLKVLEKAY
ncbi:iron-containing alcohol dehydrogenase family protein [Geosporobacter ferrireducens]|uniref:Uncharacterized protein n=1 Tax=Geosporobacter ferrireducens TaxID=1424294 RepID=A0A1D8GPI5_9FIRM|nr:iron-containing alcohol dehydrogenase [Geosporobacter ferrireducens]AOT72654.1 hypothetical protein Gferi_25725 [Geosporobacter ferrireducens]MTI55059.1 iron-containing alcohol dehydrogenase [Geosporobacter ferrireducens]